MPETTRQEHLDWCKKRALELVDMGECRQGIISMMSDLNKHPETANHSGIMLISMLMMGGHLNTMRDARDHINGFN